MLREIKFVADFYHDAFVKEQLKDFSCIVTGRPHSSDRVCQSVIEFGYFKSYRVICLLQALSNLGISGRQRKAVCGKTNGFTFRNYCMLLLKASKHRAKDSRIQVSEYLFSKRLPG